MAWHEIHDYTRTTRNAVCSMCGTARRTLNRPIPERVFTTGIYIDMEGTFDICEGCLLEGVQCVGGLTPDQADTLEAELQAAKDNLKEVEQELERASTALDALTSAFPDLKPRSRSSKKDAEE